LLLSTTSWVSSAPSRHCITQLGRGDSKSSSRGSREKKKKNYQPDLQIAELLRRLSEKGMSESKRKRVSQSKLRLRS
jgi:hypothetical protein